MKQKRSEQIIIALLFLLVVPLISAFEIATSSYSVDSFHHGSMGNDISTGNNFARSTTTYEQGSNKDASTSNYKFNSGWFNITVTTETLGNTTINSVECSNDTINYYSCANMSYQNNITHIRVNCTAESGSISEVKYTLFNSPDNTNYIDNVSYTYQDGDYYILNSSYLIQDSGDWNLTVTCYGSGNDVDSTLWQLAWGWLDITLIQPAIDTSVQIYKFFTFQSRVECVSGECGTAEVTLDPKQPDELNMVIKESSEKTWFLDKETRLTSIKISGSVENGYEGSAKMYIQHNGRLYLIFDSSLLERPDKGKITLINKTGDASAGNKTILLNLDYAAESEYDTDDDGIESINGVVDLSIASTEFKENNEAWIPYETKLCTLWETYSLDEELATTVCYGAEKCCNFAKLQPAADNWDDVFYSYYGKYGAGYKNMISSKVMYVDYNLSLENPFSEIHYSKWQTLPAGFYMDSYEFEDICEETCSLTGFNSSFYKLIFEIKNSTLNIDEILYTAINETEANQTMPGEKFEKGDILETKEGKDLGEKTEDEEAYETHFLSMEQDKTKFKVIFYHDYNGTLPIYIAGNVSYELSANVSDYLENITLNVDLIKGILPKFELHVGEQSEVFTFGKTIPVVKLKEGNYTLIDRDDLKLDLAVEFDSDESIILRGLENEEDVSVTLGSNSEEEVSSSIIAVPALSIENATIVLEKTRGVNAIISCEDKYFNYDNLECFGWNYVDVDFIENNETGKIAFTVEHFTAYAGGNLSAGETAWLTIWDENDPGMPNASQTRVTGQDIKFFADYKISQNRTKITDANCSIAFSDNITVNMIYNTTYTYYLYNRSFTNSSAYSYTVNCTHEEYSDLTATDSISVANALVKSGAVSTTTGDTPFYTTSSNPQTCSIIRAGDNCTTTWLVNATGILNTIHEFFVLYNMTSNTAYVSDNESEHINITITANDTASPVFVSAIAAPSAVINGSDVVINANAWDNILVDSTWGIITMSNGTNISIGNLPYTYKTSGNVYGRYNVTYYANDSSGNLAYTSSYFTVAEPVNITIIINVSVNAGVTANTSSNVITTVRVAGTDEVLAQARINGSGSLLLPNVPVDLEFDTTFNNTQTLMTLFEFNMSENANGSLELGNPVLYDYLITYGIKTTFSFARAQVIIFYNGTAYTDEPNLQLHKCDNFTVVNGECLSGWYDVTTAIETYHCIDGDYFRYNTTSFSGFGVYQYIAPAETITPTITPIPKGGGRSCPLGYKLENRKCVKIKEEQEHSKEEITEEVEEKDIPEQLFDITFNLEDRTIESADMLESIITFESFGTVPTPVNLTFMVLDENRYEVYREKSAITVTTEEVLRWNYENIPKLPEGVYTAVLQTLYNTDVFDEFKQEFEIKAKPECELLGFNLGKFIICWYWYIVIIFSILLLLLILLLVKRRLSKRKHNSKGKHNVRKHMHHKHLKNIAKIRGPR